MKIFDAVETARALPYGRLVSAVGQAALELAGERIMAPARLVVSIDAAASLLLMPAIGGDIGVTKLVTVHGGNARRDLPVIQGEVVVFETATGRRLALLDGPTVTSRRTAAVTLLGIKTLAPKPPETALIIGTGVQARAHVEALIEVFGVSRFWIGGTDIAKAQGFCDWLVQLHPAVAARALSSSQMNSAPPVTDVVIALTTSRVPVIPASIAARTLAIGVGAFRPDMAEFPPQLLHQRPIVVDDVDGAQHEAGDLMQANVDWGRVRALSSYLAGNGETFDVAPVFKTVGHAAWDLAAARVAVGLM